MIQIIYRQGSIIQSSLGQDIQLHRSTNNPHWNCQLGLAFLFDLDSLQCHICSGTFFSPLPVKNLLKPKFPRVADSLACVS